MLDIIAMSFGIAGTLLLSSKREPDNKELIVFTLYLVANILFMGYGLFINSIGILVLNLVYFLISIKGIYKNLGGNESE